MLLEDILNVLKKESNDIAYTAYNKSYTYKELYKAVCNIYDFILKENIDKKPIIVFGHKEFYMKASFIASAFAGFAYVPIDESVPEKRINEIINQVKPKIIIGMSKKILNELDFTEKPDYIKVEPNKCIEKNNIKAESNKFIKDICTEIEPIKYMDKEEITSIINNENYTDIDKILLKPEDIIYIIFTSGSTGIPKGVEVMYKNLDSCIKWLKSITNLSKGVILNQANFSFDLSVADLYLSLITRK